MGTGEKLTEIHTIVKNWEANGFPNCSRQDQRLCEIEKKIDWYRKAIWALAIGSGLAGVIGGCM